MLRVTQHSRRRPQARRPCSLLPTPVWAPTWQGDPSPAALGGTDPMCGLRRTPGTPKTPSCRPASSADPALCQVPGSPDLYLHLCSPHPGSRSPAAGGTAVRGDRAFPQPPTRPSGGTVPTPRPDHKHTQYRTLKLPQPDPLLTPESISFWAHEPHNTAKHATQSRQKSGTAVPCVSNAAPGARPCPQAQQPTPAAGTWGTDEVTACPFQQHQQTQTSLVRGVRPQVPGRWQNMAMETVGHQALPIPMSGPRGRRSAAPIPASQEEVLGPQAWQSRDKGHGPYTWTLRRRNVSPPTRVGAK